MRFYDLRILLVFSVGFFSFTAIPSDVKKLEEKIKKAQIVNEQISQVYNNKSGFKGNKLQDIRKKVFNYKQAVSNAYFDELDLLLKIAKTSGEMTLNSLKANEQALLDLQISISNPLNKTWKEAFVEARSKAMEKQVVIVFDDKDKEVNEHEKERFARLLIDTIYKDNWMQVEIEEETDINNWIPEFFNISAKEMPRLVNTLINATIEVNNLDSGKIPKGKIIVPPFPKQSEDCWGWASLECVGNGFKAFERKINLNKPLVKTDRFEGVGSTEVILLDETSIKAKIGTQIPKQALIFTNGHAKDRMATINLLDEGTSSIVFDGRNNPFSAKVSNLLDSASIESLTRAAARSKLWIIDWDFEHGHGSKVKSVVKQTLDNFGVDLSSHVKTIDLAPYKENVDDLRKLVNDYATHLKKNTSKNNESLVDDLKKEALYWIKNNGAERRRAIQPREIHEFILYAAISRPLRALEEENQSFATINFSMEFESNAYRIFLEKELWKYADQNRFALFNAAGQGQGWQRLSPFDVPQVLASYIGDIYNIAGLHCDHKSGTASIFSGKEVGVMSVPPPVHLVAQGCGFNYGNINPSDYGSSFASPLVATTFWLRKLSSNNRKLLTKHLIKSTVPALNINVFKKAKYDGIFDPSAALADINSFVVSQNNLISVDTCSGEFDFPSFEKISYSKPNVADEFKYEQVEIAPIICRGEKPDCLWVRFKNVRNDWDSFILLSSPDGHYSAEFKAGNSSSYVLDDFNFNKDFNYGKCSIQ